MIARERDIFPLSIPPAVETAPVGNVSRGVARRIGRRRAVEECYREALLALNQASTGGLSSRGPECFDGVIDTPSQFAIKQRIKKDVEEHFSE
eukprot:7108640-Karenia_brevis.AAC.1